MKLHLSEVTGRSVLYAFTGSQNVLENYAVNINSVIINGLESGKEYVYRVGNGVYWSEIKEFKTGYKYSDVNFCNSG